MENFEDRPSFRFLFSDQVQKDENPIPGGKYQHFDVFKDPDESQSFNF